MKLNLMSEALGKHPIHTLHRAPDGIWSHIQGARLVPSQLNPGNAVVELGNAESANQILVREGKVGRYLQYASALPVSPGSNDLVLRAIEEEDEEIDFSKAFLVLQPTVDPLEYISVTPLSGARTLCKGIWHSQGGHAQQQLLYMPTGGVVVVQHTTVPHAVNRCTISWNAEMRAFDIHN